MVDQRRRLKELQVFIAENYPEYYPKCVRRLSAEEINDKQKYFFDKYRNDFIYNALDPKIVLAFCARKKTKKFKMPKSAAAKKKALERNPNMDDKLMSFETIRKYHDSLLFGSGMQGEQLCREYFVDMKKYLDNYKKEVAQGKKDGMVEDFDADEMTYELYRLLSGYFIKKGDFFMWSFLITQWNCMARSINIDNLGFRNVQRGGDCFTCKYDYTKKDQSGENCSNKNIFANPQDPQVCFALSLGCHLSVNSTSLALREGIFLNKGTAVGSTAKIFCERLQIIISEREE